jgi:hypothetical protein
MNLLGRFFLAALFAVSATSPVVAAQVVLSDPLTSWPLNFGAQGSSVSLKNGAVHITAPPNGAGYVMYSGFTFTDMDASVTITANNATGNAAGLLFWATGPNDFYDFALAGGTNSFAVYRHVSTAPTQWQAIVPYMNNANIKTGAGAVNTLRLVTKGNSLTLYVNGQSVGSLGVMAPQGGGGVGIEGEGAAKGTSDYTFSNLTVSQ